MDRSIRCDRQWAMAVTAASILLLAGCGKSNQGPAFELTPVAGKVSLDGKPLADADIGFYPQGSAPAGYHGSGAKTDSEGRYELKTTSKSGAVPGAYKVTVSRFVGAAGAPVNLEEGMDVEQLKLQGQYKESLPERYSTLEKTELTVTVENGKVDGYDFPLTSN